MEEGVVGLYTLDEALESVGFGKFQGFVLAYAGLGWFAEAMEIMILSFIGEAVKSEWGLSSGQESLITTTVFAGMLLGANTWGIISDNYGRRKGFLSISIVTSVAGLLSTFSPNYISLVIFRGLVGFGLGGGTVFLSWLLEFVPTSNRGRWMVILSTFWTFGSIFEASLAWITDKDHMQLHYVLHADFPANRMQLMKVKQQCFCNHDIETATLSLALYQFAPILLLKYYLYVRLTTMLQVGWDEPSSHYHSMIKYRELVIRSICYQQRGCSRPQASLCKVFSLMDYLLPSCNRCLVIRRVVLAKITTFTLSSIWILEIGGENKIVMPRLNWRWLLGISSIPSFVLLLFYGVAPESPRYLCMKGSTSEAARILEMIASVNQTKLPSGILVSGRSSVKDEESTSSEDMTPLLTSRSENIMQAKSGFSSYFMLFSSQLIKITLLLWVLFFGNSFSYYGVILLTSKISNGHSGCFASITSYLNLEDASIYAETFITSLAELPGLILSAVLVDRVGRKKSMVFMFVLAFVFLLPLLSHRSVVVTTGLLFGARMCVMGTFTVACIYSPELYPTSLRATGAGLASAVGRIGGMVCPLVAVALVNDCHQTEAVVLFLVAIAVSVVSVLLFPYETKGRELSDTVISS